MSEITAEEKQTFIDFELSSLAHQPEGRDEGLGTVYERVLINRYLLDLTERDGLTKILEHPADGVTGVIGCNSLALGENGRRVSLANPVPDALTVARGHWEDAGAKPAGLIASDLDAFPFAEGAFDLVWNFCIFERFVHPEVLLAEMARVSNRYVLLMTQNCWNVGTPLHALYHLLVRQPWNHGKVSMMMAGAAKKACANVGLNVVECGPIDTPPWVDTWDMPMRGYLKALLGLFGKKWEWETPGESQSASEEGSAADGKLVKLLTWVEDNLPRWTVFWKTHHWYILAEKSPGE